MKTILKNKYRMFARSVMTLVLLATNAPALGAPPARDPRYDGTVVSITGDKLVMATRDGKEHSHALTGDAKLTLDGKACKTSELKPGTRIHVTMLGADNIVAKRIEGFDKNLAFANNQLDGRFVSVTRNNLEMTGMGGHNNYTRIVTGDVKITCDGKVCKSSDLKPGMRIRVTSQSNNPRAAIQIEALDKNLAFAGIHYDGIIVSITGNKLAITDTLGQDERTCTLIADVKVTCDRKACKSSDLQPGMRIRVTSQRDDPRAASQIEAIDKNLTFSSLETPGSQ